MPEKSKYSTVEVAIPEPYKSRILKFIDEFIDREDLSEAGIEDYPHITIKYGLHDTTPDKLKKVVKSTKPIMLVLGKTSIFEGNGVDVVKITVVSTALRKLNKLLAKELEVTDTFPTYEPHLTLAYVKPEKGKKYINDKTFNAITLTFNKIIFSPSEGKDTTINLIKE